MQPGAGTESEVQAREPDTREAGDPPAAPDTRAKSPVVSDSQDDYLLGSPSAGRVVAILLVAGIAGAVGLVMASVVAMLVTAAVGAVTAWLVAHDWVPRGGRQRAGKRHVTVSPGWASRSWSGQAWGERGVGRRAA
ncbi:hypothetical protein EGT67_02075 [Prescottella agglutinans]|uniref:Uncharacterized protein n=1 Tax=Prescottella agglutinans TaxID=1644129 RepID=A0A3S3AJ21_9NOCA|nr:hypothetical protein [Prescottella agglutinans]RVW11252.1 hypothetical protein EGT67_02075 [Prescottella agglutinans]